MNMLNVNKAKTITKQNHWMGKESWKTLNGIVETMVKEMSTTMQHQLNDRKRKIATPQDVTEASNQYRLAVDSQMIGRIKKQIIRAIENIENVSKAYHES